MRGKDLYEKMTDIDDDFIIEAANPNIKGTPFYKKWGAIAACFAVIIAIAPMALHFLQNSDKGPCPPELVIELNDKIYSVVNWKKSPAYENYNLEETITPNLLGEYLGEATVPIDNEGTQDTFKLYQYSKNPPTEYNWYPRIVVENSKGEYYHALIGSVFNSREQTAAEVLSVYGLLSADDIVSIQKMGGKKVTDKEFILKFYNGLFTKTYGDNDFLQKNVYQNTEIDESQIEKLYGKYADDTTYLKVELTDGLLIGVSFTSHNYAEVDHGLYFKVDNSWLNLVSFFK